MSIVDLLFPKVCVGCKREGKYICSDCRTKLVVPEQICPVCCKPSLDGWTHSRCRENWGMDRLIVGLPYRGIVQECLKKVKYRNSWNVAEFLYGLCEFKDVKGDGVTCVPMWRAKQQQRGFNQAEIIVKLLAHSYGTQYYAILDRVRETKPMFGLTKRERRENIDGAFKLNSKSSILQLSNVTRVILVDDVWTTGSTMRECTKVLKRSGVREVWGVTLAR